MKDEIILSEVIQELLINMNEQIQELSEHCNQMQAEIDELQITQLEMLQQ